MDDISRMPEPGEAVPWHFLPAIVAASYFASLCGSLLTVEILHRRGTGLGNWRSWLETLACAVSMGLIGIWCMHFIGNRAIIMDSGQPTLQLVYNPGFNTLSVFLPIIGLTMAFSVAEFPSKSTLIHWLLLACTGVFAGLSIVGMHYMGNFGITNYRISYSLRYLVASILIAIGDCLGVLVIFYTWRDTWISSWWKRLLCAALLSGGVTSMHFTASTGCQYNLKHETNKNALQSRNTQVEVAGALCGAAALTILGVLCLTHYRSKKLKSSAQKVMLACAVFDPDGRLLVTTEGYIPAHEITTRYHHRSFDEEFDVSHPVFQWIFRVTRSWCSVSELIPMFKSHLGAVKEDSTNNSRPSSAASSTLYEPETYNDYSVVFRERFCIAASALASSMSLPLEKLGVLYDDIIDTGTMSSEKTCSRRNTVTESGNMHDLESSSYPRFGKGQLLFLVRQLAAEETDRLLNAGFRFASIQHVGRNIANTMQIPLATFEGHCAGLRQFLRNLDQEQKSGTWLSLFTLIGKPHGRGFDVAAKRNNKGQLPDVPLLPHWPEKWQMEFLSRLDGARTGECVAILEDKLLKFGLCDANEGHLASSMLQAIKKLSMQVPDHWFREARFFAKPIPAHYNHLPQRKTVPIMLYSFISVADLHDSCSYHDGVTKVPLTFFGSRQRVYPGSPDHMALAREIHQEFGPVLTRRAARRQITLPKTPLQKIISKSDGSRSNSTDSTFDMELADRSYTQFSDTKTPSPSGSSRSNTWGGIMINSETVVHTSSTDDTEKLHTDCGMGVGTKTACESACGTAKAEFTFVEELIAVARARLTSTGRGVAPR